MLECQGHVSPVMTMTPNGDMYNIAFNEETQEYVLSAHPVGGAPPGLQGRDGKILIQLESGGVWNEVRFLALSQDILQWLVTSSDVGRLLCDQGLLSDASICSPLSIETPPEQVSGGKVAVVVVILVLVVVAVAVLCYFGFVHKGGFSKGVPTSKAIDSAAVPIQDHIPSPTLPPTPTQEFAPTELSSRLAAFTDSNFIAF
jgi:hypothetical protein